MHVVEVSYYTNIENLKRIDISEMELEHLKKNKALCSNIEIEKAIMVKLTGEDYTRRKAQMLLIQDVQILVSIY
jgi:hypothetical protein